MSQLEYMPISNKPTNYDKIIESSKQNHVVKKRKVKITSQMKALCFSASLFLLGFGVAKTGDLVKEMKRDQDAREVVQELLNEGNNQYIVDKYTGAYAYDYSGIAKSIDHFLHTEEGKSYSRQDILDATKSLIQDKYADNIEEALQNLLEEKRGR